MKFIRHFSQRYVDWVIKLGRFKFSLLGFVILGIFALSAQIFFNHLFIGKTYWEDILRSIAFGLISAPFFIYFFNLLVERLELSRQHLFFANQQLNKNIDELNQANTHIEQQANLLTSLLNASPDLIFYHTSKGELLDCNQAYERLTGKTKQDLRKIKISEMFPINIAKEMFEKDQEILTNNKGSSDEYWLEYPNGYSACFEIRKVPYFDHINHRHCLMGFGRDITERKHYQDVIEKTSRDKTTLMTTISHELRTPLNGIIGLSRILLDGTLNQEQRNYLQTIHVSAVSLGQIFNDIIDLEKLDSSRIELTPQPTDFMAWINDINNFALLITNQKKLNFCMQCAKDLPSYLDIDNIRLSQILWNLINNAVKFTPKGKITLKIERVSDKEIRFILTDTGIGIAPEELEKIFTMYYQVNTHNDGRKYLGSGIGLSVAKRIAKLMNGDLTAQSEIGKGATFTLTIQVKEIESIIENPLPKVEIPLNILLVEDIEMNIIVAKSVLEKLGYQVDVAINGQQAIKKFEQQHYDLILLDIQLPDMTGFDIAQSLRQKYQEGIYDYLPPLIALTANVMKNKAEYLAQGMDDVLHKPLSLKELNQCLLTFFAEDALPLSTAQPKAVQSAVENQQLDPALFDLALIDELNAMLGTEFLHNNLSLFQQSMPTYLQELENVYQQYLHNQADKKQVTNTAHKIKGATASIGLKRLQEIAQLAQQDESEQWEHHIQDWIDSLQKHWQRDCEMLHQYFD